jgi:hypothetical protein
MTYKTPFDEYSLVEMLRDWEIDATTAGNLEEAKAYRRVINSVLNGVVNQRPHVKYRI